VPDGRLERILKGFGDVRGREARAALSLSAYFFLITFTFYIIKPVKESFLIGTAPSWWPFAELATALLTAVTAAVHDSIGAPLESIRVWVQEFTPREYMIAGVLAADRKK